MSRGPEKQLTKPNQIRGITEMSSVRHFIDGIKDSAFTCFSYLYGALQGLHRDWILILRHPHERWLD